MPIEMRWNIDERLDAVEIMDAEKSDAVNRIERDLRARRAREAAKAEAATRDERPVARRKAAP